MRIPHLENRALFYGLICLGLTLFSSVALAVQLAHQSALHRVPEKPDVGMRERLQQKLRLAVLVLQDGKLNEAEQQVQQILAEDPDIPEAWQILGVIFFRKGQYHEARMAFHYLLKLQPDNPAAYNNLSQCYVHLDERDNAISAAQQAIMLNPKNLPIRLNLVSLYLYFNEVESARQCWLDAQKMGASSSMISPDEELANYIEKWDTESPAPAPATDPAAEQPPLPVHEPPQK